MSLADFDDRDLDRLADYLAGELPLPAADEIERLLRSESSWSHAFAELTAADPQVQAMLRADGRAQIDPMPADVIARVDAALADAALADATRVDSAGRTVAKTPIKPGSPGRHAATSRVVPLDAQRSRRRRWLTTAAAVVVGLGLCTGVVKLLGNQTQYGTGASTNAAGAQSGQANDSLAGPPRAYSPTPKAPSVPGATRSYVIGHSQTNYTLETLGKIDMRTADSGDNHDFASGGTSPAPAAGSPDLLPNGLDACLAQVTAVHPGTVSLVEYARYESQPAVIIVIQRASGQIVVAVGATCGAPGPDELAAVAS